MISLQRARRRADECTVDELLTALSVAETDGQFGLAVELIWAISEHVVSEV